MRARDERFRLMLAHRAAAAALEASLKEEAAAEFELHRARVSWDWAGAGSVIASLNHDAVIVTDETALMEWMAIAIPHQVQRVCRLEPINPGWVNKVFLAALEPIPAEDEHTHRERPVTPGERLTALDPETGAVVPGVRWVKGGGLRSVAVKADPAATRRLNLAAAEYAADAGPMPGLTTGESDARNTPAAGPAESPSRADPGGCAKDRS